MSTSERTALRVLLDLEWVCHYQRYCHAGKPFGSERGVDLWIEFDQHTTVN